MAAASSKRRKTAAARPATPSRKRAIKQFERQLSNLVVLESLQFAVRHATAAQNRILALVKQVEMDVTGPFAKQPPDRLLLQVMTGLAELHLTADRIRANAFDALTLEERKGLNSDREVSSGG